MKRKTALLTFMILAFANVCAYAANVSFKGTTNKNPLEYQLGETVVFTVECFEDDKPADGKKLRWVRTGDDGKRETADVVYSAAKPLTIETTIDKPGFVRIQVFQLDANDERIGNEHDESLQFNGGAGARIDQIDGFPEPSDFDEFWNRQKTILDQTPIKAQLDPLDVGDDAVVAYDVKVACAGLAPVSGYLVMPRNAEPKSLPARVQYQGYGVYSAGLNVNAGRNQIYFEINAHGILNGQPDSYYDHLRNTFLKSYGFPKEGNVDPNSSYWCGVILRALRALQYVKTLPEWDGEHLSTGGGSQGGMQCLTVAGLDPDVSEVDAAVPWFCDVSGAEENKRIDSWFMPPWIEGLGYFDVANHAKRIKAKVSIFAGLGDYVCPPSGEMVLYNSIRSEKKILFRQGRTHGFEPKTFDDFTLESHE